MEQSIEKKSNKRILTGTILGYISFFVNILSGLLLTPWIVANIGDSQYAIYTLCFSIINIFLFDFGLSLTTNAYLSKLKAQNDIEGVKKFTSTIFKIYLIIDIIIFAIFVVALFLIDPIYVGMTVSERSQLKICFIIVGLFSLVSFPSTVFNGSMYSEEKFSLLRLIDIINKLIMMAATFISIKLGFGVYGLVTSYAFAGLVSILSKFIWFKFFHKGKLFYKEKSSKSYIKEIVKFSLWAALLSFASRLVFNIAPSILGIVSNSTEIAIFGIISTIEGYIYTFGSMASSLFMPKTFRSLTSTTDPKMIEERAIKIGKTQSFMISMIIFGFMACGYQFIDVWMKSSTYSPAYIGIIIVSLYQLINIPEIVYYDSMMYQGKVKPLAIVASIKAIANLGLSFLFGYLFGAVGVCAAIGITRILEQIVYNFIYKKYLGVSFIKLFTNAIFPSLFSGFTIFVLIKGLSNMINISNSICGFIVYGCIFVMLFVVTNYFVQRKDFNNLLSKIFKK